ncbi:ComEC/Rec2 family competence protein [Patescibacteria group bacterium]|nr:ComEC/Rec2 family competence protein [Patescibacteria group bacterium]MBU1906862.1 ComEC/Rec2 family competence protein [Patescibacteria group bacterium]
MEWVFQLTESRSKRFFVILLGMLSGIFVGALLDRPLPDYPMFVGFVALIAVAILARSDNRKVVSADVLTDVTPNRSNRTRLIALVLAFFILGLFRFSQTFFPPNAYLVSETLNREVRIEGVIADEVIEKNQGQQVVIDNVLVADNQALGKVMVWLPKYPAVSYGDQIVFRCQLEQPEPFDGFAYDKYLRSRGILAVCWAPASLDVRENVAEGFSLPFAGTLKGSATLRGNLFAIKRAVLDKTEEVFAEPYSTFLAGLLFGGKGSLATDLRQDFVDTGTAHILAASGYNVSIFSRFLFLALVAFAFKRKPALAIVSVMIGLYVLMSGLDPAVTRAGVMGLIVLFGRGIGRAGSVRNILALTAAVMLFINPYLLLDDVGFQLSFLSTIGLVSLVPKIEPYFKFVPTVGGFREAIMCTVAATGMSLPILVLQFGAVSTVSVLVNLLVLPLVPYAMGFGAIAIAVGFISTSLAAIVAAPAWACLAVMMYVIRFFGALPFSLVALPYNELIAVIAAVLVVGILYLLYKQKREYLPSGSEIKRPVLASVSISILLLSSVLFGQYDSGGSYLNVDHKFRVWFFDVGQGDAIFIETPDGQQILVDGGPGEAVLTKLGAVMPFWDRSIDLVIATHPHSDHIGGLVEVLERYQVEEIVTTGVRYRSSYYDEWWNRIAAEGAELTYVDEPMNLLCPDSLTAVTPDESGVTSVSSSCVKIDAIYPTRSLVGQRVEDVNQASIVLLLTIGETTLLLTGDTYSEQEIEFVNLLPEIDVIKVPHHGSLSSSDPRFVSEIDPEFAIFTVGVDNSYGLPQGAVLRRYLDQGSQIFRTDYDGDILMISDGGEPTLQSRPLIF